MSGLWLTANKAVFVRDLLRDFCIVWAALAEQNLRFAASGAISHAVLRELLGRDMRKGVFWRLKDTAHHLFRTPRRTMENAEPGIPLWQFSNGKIPDGMVQQNAEEAMLDWCIGYAFHECVKLKEDAFQRQHYANRLEQMRGQTPQCEAVLERLFPLTAQTRESIGREMARILHVLGHAKDLLLRYLRTHGDNGHVARFLVAEEKLVRAVFAAQYEDLLASLYGPRPEACYLLAARACLEGGRPQQALRALDALNAASIAAPGAPHAEDAARLRHLAETFDPTHPLQGAALNG